jgi:hypothetical protein
MKKIFSHLPALLQSELKGEREDEKRFFKKFFDEIG